MYTSWFWIPYIMSTCSLGAGPLLSSGWQYGHDDRDSLDLDHRSRVLTITTTLIEPYSMARKFNASQGVPSDSRGAQLAGATSSYYEGYIVDLIQHLATRVGFKYRLVPVWDGMFGHRQQDGTWNGMIGELMRREADIAAAPLFITPRRSRVIDFTRPYMNVQAAMVIRKPPPGRPLEFASVEELVRSQKVIYGTINRGIVVHEFRSTNNSLYQRMWNKMNKGTSNTKQKSKSKQNHNNINKNSHQSFTSVAYPDVLTNSNEAGLARVRGEHLTAEFSYDSSHNRGKNTPEISIRPISDDRYAFILPDTIADYITTRKPCDLQKVGEGFLMNRGYGLAVPKGSSLLSYLNRGLNLLEADGTLHRLHKKWWTSGNQCTPPLPPRSQLSGRMFRSSDYTNRAGTVHGISGVLQNCNNLLHVCTLFIRHGYFRTMMVSLLMSTVFSIT